MAPVLSERRCVCTCCPQAVNRAWLYIASLVAAVAAMSASHGDRAITDCARAPALMSAPSRKITHEETDFPSGSVGCPIAVGEHCQSRALLVVNLQLQTSIQRATEKTQETFRGWEVCL